MPLKGTKMKLHQTLRLLAGSMILLTVFLTVYVHPSWIWLGAFVGLNLVQSAFSKTCPAIWFFRRMGIREEGANSAGSC